MEYSEYNDLMPVDDIENGDEYIAALNWAFQNKKVKNIALTGPYGSGKSSVIETFLKKSTPKAEQSQRFFKKRATQDSVLKISMATFIRGDAEESAGSDGQEAVSSKIPIDSDEVERGILKQLFYKVKPDKIPQSRYRKLYPIHFGWVFLHWGVGIAILAFLRAIFAPSAYAQTTAAIQAFLPAGLSAPGWVAAAKILMLLVLSAIGSYLSLIVISRFKIKQIKLPADTVVQSDGENSDSVFNKNLDEIMYFFESTGYRTVFFEDLDRLTDPKIFVHLRELNNLLNNDDAIKNKPIVFVYAVRDDIFSREDRTKFFDFIIPIIPVINSTNSGEILLQKLEKARKNGICHDISQEFVLDVAPYISDMRVLQNIYNEFVVYKKTLRVSQDLSLSDEQMMAMLVFKNLYPRDFADLQDEKGIVKTAFWDKQDFLAEKKREIQSQIDHGSDVIQGAKSDVAKSVRELKDIMVVSLMGGFYRFKGFSMNGAIFGYQVPESDFMKDGFDLRRLIQAGYKYIGIEGSGDKKIDAKELRPYVDRWEKIKEVGEKGLENLQKELQGLKAKQHALSGMTLAQLLKTFPAEKVLSEEVRNNDLLVFLLRRGYLDEKYANYINYFKGTSITKEDMNFILSVKNQTPLAFEYSLTKTAQVVERLQPYEFEQKAICNFDLLEELLANGPSEKLTPFLAQLADGSERSWKFLEECVDRTAWQERLIGLLAKEWNGMWARIAGDDTLTYERQLMYLRAILNTSDAETLKAQNQDNCLADYLEQHEDILQKLAPCDTAKIISAISSLRICFEALQTAGVPKEVLDCVVEGCHYAINEAMIRTVVSYKNVELAGMFETQPYTTILCLGYDPMTEYIHSRIALYVRNVVLAQAELSDRAEDVVDMLIRLKGDSELRLQVIRQEKFRLNCIEDCAGELARQEGKVWQPVWDALLEKNAISENWENVVSYWGAYQFSEGLKQYLEQHADGLAGMDTAIVPDEFIRKFILEESHGAAKEKLLPVLRMEKFDFDILAIDEATLGILVDCRYFDFTADFYLKLIKVSQEMGLKFILKNQDSYMELRKNIPMTNDLFENLMLSRDLLQKYRDELFSEYAKDRMTEKVALQMKGLQLPVTKVILNVAWNRVELKDRISLLSEHCGILDAAELLQKFREIGGSYAQLADRTRRHEVTLPSTPQNRRLAEYMQEIGYITSYEEVKEKGKIREPLLKQKKNQQLLKLRVRPVKA